MPVKTKLRRAQEEAADAAALMPVPVTLADRVVLEIRKFLAAGIFFNAQAAEKAGLGMTDMQMLHMLQLHGPSTPSRLAAWTRLSSGGITVALDRLEKLGLVKRGRTPDDRRVVRIELTARGQRLAIRLRDAHIENCRAMLARLAPGQREEFLRLAAQISGK